MNIVGLSMFCSIGLMLFAATAFPAEPNLSFELQPGSKSYHFTLENSTNTAITCKSISIKSDIGSGDCSQIQSSYTYTFRNKTLQSGNVILNSDFGLDYLSNARRRSGSNELVFCGEPQITLNCN